MARNLSPSDLIIPTDRQGIGLLDCSEIAGGRADVAVSKQEADGFQSWGIDSESAKSRGGLWSEVAFALRLNKFAVKMPRRMA